MTAYVGATMFQVAPTHAANADISGSSMNAMVHEQDGQGDKMPCKGMLAGCVTDLGCIFLVDPADAECRSLHRDGVVVGDLHRLSSVVARAFDQARLRPSHLPRLNRSGPTWSVPSFLARLFSF